MNVYQTIKRLVAALFLYSILLGCSNGGHVEVELGDTHLQQVPAGQWLSEFNLKYGVGAQPIKQQIAEELRARGTLVEEYMHEENSNTVTTMVWNYNGKTFREEYYRGGIWEGPKIIAYQEYYQGGLAVWFTIDLAEGIPYVELLPDLHQSMPQDRMLEHAATVKSTADNARLFLFGYGIRCTRISLF